MITIIFRFDQLKVLKLTVKAGISRPFSKLVASPKEPGTNAFVTQTEFTSFLILKIIGLLACVVERDGLTLSQEHGRTGGIPNLPQSVRSISLPKISSDALPLISCLVSRENF